MFEDLGEQESFFDYLDECRTWPDTERLEWKWARLRIDDLQQAVSKIEAQNTKPPYKHLASYEAELLAELDSLLSLCWYPSELERDMQRAKELMLKAMFLGSELKAGALKLSAAKGESFTGNKRGLSPLYVLVRNLFIEHGRTTSTKELWRLLKQHQGGDVIEEITDDENGGEIFTRGKGQPTTFKAFSNEASKIRQSIPSPD
jgi:hypothetical protein